MTNHPIPMTDKAITPQQAFSNVISRQRDEALNRCAELEVHLAMALQENATLKENLAALEVPADAPPPAPPPANRAQRRQRKG